MQAQMEETIYDDGYWLSDDLEDYLEYEEPLTKCNACFGTGLDRNDDVDCLVCWGDGVV
jgi:hypothetical protein